MEFNLLLKTFNLHYHNIKDKTKALKFLAKVYQDFKFKQSKLKLGRIKFEMHEIKVETVVVSRSFEMVFTEQPVTWAARQGFERALKRYSWNWDIYNIMAAVIIILTLLHITTPLIYDYLVSVFPTLLGPTPESDIEMVKFSLTSLSVDGIWGSRDLMSLVAALTPYLYFN